MGTGWGVVDGTDGTGADEVLDGMARV